MPCLSARDIVFRVGEGRSRLQVLSGVSLDAPAGEVTAVVGASGAGKSSLLHLLCGLDRPHSGSVELDGIALSGLSEEEVMRVRRDRIGLLLPAASFLPTVTVRENVALPLLIARRPPADEAVDALLERVGLGGRRLVRSADLTPDERQRVALARALLGGPSVLLADEPADELDDEEGAALLELLREIAAEEDVAVVLFTRDRTAAEAVADHVVELDEGRVVAPRAALAA